jgi:hypothetical protein
MADQTIEIMLTENVGRRIHRSATQIGSALVPIAPSQSDFIGDFGASHDRTRSRGLHDQRARPVQECPLDLHG